MKNKAHTAKTSTDQLRELVLKRLSHVGLRNNEQKPGDGRYSALLSKTTR